LRANHIVSEIIDKGEFSLWVPNVVEFDFSKGGLDEEESSDENKVPAGYTIKGYCSTESVDRQDEVVVQKGLDFSEFVHHGYFNDNHKQGTVDIVGIPQKAELHEDRGWYTEGYLLRGYPPSEKIVQLAKALKNTPRRLGFSIEGKVLERSEYDNRILRAKVRNVAVTNCPVNTDCTWDLVSKAFASPDEIEESFAKRLKKALAAGNSNPGGTGGAALRAQSLEGGKKQKKTRLLSHTRKGMTLSEAVAFLRAIRPQYSEEVCARIARVASFLNT
jgi:hypothetical protein